MCPHTACARFHWRSAFSMAERYATSWSLGVMACTEDAGPLEPGDETVTVVVEPPPQAGASVTNAPKATTPPSQDLMLTFPSEVDAVRTTRSQSRMTHTHIPTPHQSCIRRMTSRP